MDLQITAGVVGRILKQATPDQLGISGDTRNEVQRLVNLFVIYLTTAAHNEAKGSKRPIIGGDHIMAAMEAMGFDGLLEPLFDHLLVLRQEKSQRDRRDGSSQGSRSKSSSSRKRGRDTEEKTTTDESQPQPQQPQGDSEEVSARLQDDQTADADMTMDIGESKDEADALINPTSGPNTKHVRLDTDGEEQDA